MGVYFFYFFYIFLIKYSNVNEFDNFTVFFNETIVKPVQFCSFLEGARTWSEVISRSGHASSATALSVVSLELAVFTKKEKATLDEVQGYSVLSCYSNGSCFNNVFKWLSHEVLLLS